MRGAHEHVDTKIDGEFRLQEGKVAHLKVRRVARAALYLVPSSTARVARFTGDTAAAGLTQQQSLLERERERDCSW